MLTERDMTIVEWIGRQGAARAENVMTRFSIGRTATYRRLHELVEFGLVRRHRLLYNDGACSRQRPKASAVQASID
jgi:predicted transcriptional regulator